MFYNKPQPKIPFVDLAAQLRFIESEINEAITDVLHRTDFILGGSVQLFEEEFARYCGATHAVGVDSGLSALELALRAYGIGYGDEVITAANTFIATALAISHTGAKPVLVDVDPQTCTMDVSAVRRAVTPQTKAIIPVHLFGHPAEMDPLNEIAREQGCIVIEDACQAHGARYKGRRVGTLGHAAAFSFYPGKNLGAYGDGGIIVTNDSAVAKTLEMLRNYGQREKYHHVLRGFNHRLDTMQAAVLRVKLKYLERWNEARREHACLYAQLLADMDVITPQEANYAESVWHLYVVRVQERDSLSVYLAEQGITTGIHYPVPIHLQPAYRDLGYAPGTFPVTEQLAGQVLSLPMYPELTRDDIEFVASGMRAFRAQPAVELLAS
jgi:dTDP-4-amino-4,6-dideoxygalactose transaminase